MTEDYRFAVVLCSHNGDRFVREQIQSILDQEERVETIHVHDFASRDDTRAVLQAIQAEAGNVVRLTFHDHAPGASASFLEALRHVAPLLGERTLVFLADQDDVWLPIKLTTVRQEVERRRLDAAEPMLLFHDVQVVDAALNPIRPTYYTGNPFQVPRDLDPRRLMMANPAIGHTMLLSAALVRIVADWPESDRYLMHDWLAILIATRLGRVEVIPQALSLYRQHDANILGAYRTRGRIASVSRLLRFIDRMIHQATAFSRALPTTSARASSRVERLCRRGYRSTALALSWAALVHGPTWQRKAISMLLFARAIAGPRENETLRGTA